MNEPSLSRPDQSEYAPPFGKYIDLIPEGDILSTLAAQLGAMQRLLGRVSEVEASKDHPPYAWTIKQVVGHITDCERVFAHRAHWLARNGGAPLAPFDENAFMAAVDFNRWPLDELVDEFEHVRRGYLALLRHLDNDGWLRRGVVGDHAATARAFAWVAAGHAQHHLNIIEQRLKAT